METKIDVLRERLKEEILLFKNAVASGEPLVQTKKRFITAKNTFAELKTLTDSYQANLQEVMNDLINSGMD